jgi:hypothetical protein
MTNPGDAMDTSAASAAASLTPSSSSSAPAPSTSNATLESYLLLANGVHGAAVVGLMQQLLSANSLFVFGEMLDHPNIQAAKEVG